MNHAVTFLLNAGVPRRCLVAVAGIAAGYSNAQIAEVMHTTEQVVKNYLRTAYRVTGTHTRLQLFAYLSKRTLVAGLAETLARETEGAA